MKNEAMATDSKRPTVVRWQRGVPVYGIPILTRPFAILVAIATLGICLAVYREAAGLGPSTGLNDAYAWGIWKTFNVMVLTGIGSGGFAVGIAARVFFRRNLHAVMRTALLTSFIAYFTGLLGLGVDVARPWNFRWALLPWKWNGHSPMLEVAICMPLYAFFPLLLENIPPILERWFYLWKESRPAIDRIMPVIRVTYPWVVALAYALPMMHQSSLGALMLLGGDRVNALWQTPMLPYLYVAAAAFLGFACVILTSSCAACSGSGLSIGSSWGNWPTLWRSSPSRGSEFASSTCWRAASRDWPSNPPVSRRSSGWRTSCSFFPTSCC